MISYTFCDKSGNITGNATLLSDKEAELNCPKNCFWVAGYYSPDEYFFSEKTPTELPEKPEYPSHFDVATKSWVWDEQVSWATLRQERQQRLAASDWTQVPDAPVDRLAWAEYRQALRDLPANTTDPRNPNWPTTP